jgi:alpha-methylacyl-CoA racemase
MVLGDLGADVVSVTRPGAPSLPEAYPAVNDTTYRNRTRVVADLRDASARDAVLRLIDRADAIVEGFRPGTAERLGLGPDVCLARNPRLVYGRVTGWGQTGPRSARAGHDINYLAVTGVLDNLGAADGGPVPPLNLVADFGGGSMLLVAGVLAALVERASSGLGQVVDAAMTEGAGLLAHMMWNLRGHGTWETGRGANLLDGSCPFYTTYRCADGRYVAVGALEPQFFAQLLSGLGIDDLAVADRWDRSQWARLRTRLAAAFATRTRDQWESVFGATDACVSPVLTYDEARDFPQLRERAAIEPVAGIDQPMPAPRFSRTPPDRPAAPDDVPSGLDDVIARWAAPAG